MVDIELQRAIREVGGAAMHAELHDHFVGLKREGKLQLPERPGLTLAWLALGAPAEMSGETVWTDDERVGAAIEDRRAKLALW
ncbi:MAG TPA: hypothetical protein VER55_05140 [Ardenticatenaceae bacterium]|nr:hypothetical protein [Ardenticatenaceae bacterium]